MALGDDPVDRAWQQVAADLTEQYPGWEVRYGWLGFTAGRGSVTLGPAGWRGIIAQLDLQPRQPAAAVTAEASAAQPVSGVSAPGWPPGWRGIRAGQADGR